jgi:hypothetical protein
MSEEMSEEIFGAISGAIFEETLVHCPTCVRYRPVEPPPCADGHGADCPERLCTACGTALLVGPAPERALGERPVRRAA